jgi:hypothetical protein
MVFPWLPSAIHHTDLPTRNHPSFPHGRLLPQRTVYSDSREQRRAVQAENSCFSGFPMVGLAPFAV